MTQPIGFRLPSARCYWLTLRLHFELILLGNQINTLLAAPYKDPELPCISGAGYSSTISSLLDKVEKGAEVRIHIRGHSFYNFFLTGYVCSQTSYS